MPGEATISGFQIGEVKINVENSEGKSLKEVCAELGVRFEGTNFFINGTRLSAGEADTAKVNGGDEVRVAPKSEGGV